MTCCRLLHSYKVGIWPKLQQGTVFKSLKRRDAFLLIPQDGKYLAIALIQIKVQRKQYKILIGCKLTAHAIIACTAFVKLNTIMS